MRISQEMFAKAKFGCALLAVLDASKEAEFSVLSTMISYSYFKESALNEQNLEEKICRIDIFNISVLSRRVICTPYIK